MSAVFLCLKSTSTNCGVHLNLIINASLTVLYEVLLLMHQNR